MRQVAGRLAWLVGLPGQQRCADRDAPVVGQGSEILAPASERRQHRLELGYVGQAVLADEHIPVLGGNAESLDHLANLPQRVQVGHATHTLDLDRLDWLTYR